MNEYLAEKEFQRDVAERMDELRCDLLWSERGLKWFEDYMMCRSAINIAKPLHELLRGVDTASNLRKIRNTVEIFCEDLDEPELRKQAETIVRDDYKEAA